MKNFIEKCAKLGIDLVQPVRKKGKGFFKGRAIDIFPYIRKIKHKRCFSAHDNTQETSNLLDNCKSAKSFYYNKDHITVRCDRCNTRRFLEYKKLK